MENKQNKPMSIKEQLMRISAFRRDLKEVVNNPGNDLSYDGTCELIFDPKERRFKLKFNFYWDAKADWDYNHAPRYQKYKEDRKYITKYWSDEFLEAHEDSIQDDGTFYPSYIEEEGIFDPSERIEIDDGIYSTGCQYFNDRNWKDQNLLEWKWDVLEEIGFDKLAEDAFKKSTEKQLLIKQLEADQKNVKSEAVKTFIEERILSIKEDFKSKFADSYFTELLAEK